MAKRDKRKMVRVAVTGISFSEAAQRVLKSLPDYLILKKRDGNLSVGVPMIFGTGGDTITGAEYYKRLLERSVPNEVPENLKQYPFVPAFGIDPYDFDKEAKGSWYDKEVESVNEKQVGWIQRYHDCLEKHPPILYDTNELIDRDKITAIINKLSKQ